MLSSLLARLIISIAASGSVGSYASPGGFWTKFTANANELNAAHGALSARTETHDSRSKHFHDVTREENCDYQSSRAVKGAESEEVIKATANFATYFMKFLTLLFSSLTLLGLALVNGKSLMIAFLCNNNLILRNFSSSSALHRLAWHDTHTPHKVFIARDVSRCGRKFLGNSWNLICVQELFPLSANFVDVKMLRQRRREKVVPTNMKAFVSFILH
jgi:hypothetical protein